MSPRLLPLLAASAALSLAFAACGQESDPGAPRAATSEDTSNVLALGERTVSPFVDYGTPNQSKSTKVAVEVLRVRKGSIADFKDFNLDRKQRRSSP